MQYWIMVATNCHILTCFMNLSYVLGHKQVSSLLFSVLYVFCEYCHVTEWP
jgi:hypothetical protein